MAKLIGRHFMDRVFEGCIQGALCIQSSQQRFELLPDAALGRTIPRSLDAYFPG
jgi:hypothetical protein